MLSRDAIREMLRVTRTIAVVGLSDDPDRPSYGVASYLQRQGFTIIPVNPRLTGPVLGAQPYASLREVPVPIDLVDVFRRPEHVAEIVDETIAIGARSLWLQLGVVDEVAAARAEAAGLQVVMDRCIAVDHRLLLG